MDIVMLIVRIMLMVFGTAAALFYLLSQMWQKVPSPKLALKVQDSLTYGIVGFCFGLGTNSYWGLLAFVPLLLVKLISHLAISKKRVAGSGRWMEIQWHRFSPKGFRMPQEAMDQIKRLPSDTHFIVPRFVSLFAIRFFLKSMRKNAHKMPQQMRGQEGQAMDMVEGIARNISRLDSGKTEKLSLPFGELKVTRL